MPNKKVETEIKSLQLRPEQVTRTDSIFNANQIQKLFNSTKERYKYNRPARGGGEWTYVRASYVRRVLDSIFGFNHSFNVETSLAEAFEVASKTGSCIVRGTLTGRVKVDGEWVEISKTDFGRAEVKFKKGTKEPLDFGNDLKAATSDCFKRCAARLGVAADVYDPMEFQEIEIVGAEEASEKRKNIDEKIEAAKKQIENTQGPAQVGTS